MIDWLRSCGRVVENPAGCWVWQGRKNRSGYPSRRNYPAVHRGVYAATHGAIPDGDHIHHKCGVALCVNPGHLALSTARENIAEMLARTAYTRRIEALEHALADCRASKAAPHSPTT